MPKLLVRTYAAAEDCESHLKETGTAGTEIESYLTQYLLVILCADIQQEIYRLSEERTAASLRANISETGRPWIITVGRRKKSHFDEHQQNWKDCSSFCGVGSFAA